MKKTLKDLQTTVDLMTRQRFTSVLNTYINNAYDEICSLGDFDFLRKDTDIAATTDQTVFDYPSDFRKAELLYLSDSSLSNDGQVFTQENNFINIANNPDSGKRRFEFHSAPGGDLKLRYFYNPSPLSNDSDIPVLPEYFHRFIEVKASLQLLRIDNRDKGQIQILESERMRLQTELMSYQISKPTNRKYFEPTGVNGEPIKQFEPLGDGY